MNCILKVILFVAYCGLAAVCNAQADTTTQLSVQLSTLTIQEPMTEVNAPFRHQVRQTTVEVPVAQLLTENSLAYVKSYGLGSSASISLRGGSAVHTQLQWEGVPINNPMLGQKDISLIPFQLFSKLTVESGGNSSEHGSGAICGVVSMKEDDLASNLGLTSQFQLGYGSFGRRSISAKVGYGTSKQVSWFLAPYYEKAENDFSYRLGTMEKKQSNAQYENRGMMLGAEKSLRQSKFKFSYWYQETERNIPPVTTQNNSSAHQYDLLHRLRLSHISTLKSGKLKTVAAYFREHNDFADPERLQTGENYFDKYFLSSRLIRNFKKRVLEVKAEGSMVQGHSLSYDVSTNALNQLAFYVGYEDTFRFGKLNLGVRKEWNNITQAPFISSATLSKNFSEMHFFHIQLSQEYRVPTLNELYWMPGGNKALEAEQGWSSELGYGMRLGTFSLFSTVYARQLNDWILWIPQQGSPIWSPVNVAQVTSRGWEAGVNKKWRNESTRFKLELKHAYTFSVHENDVPQGIQSGDQLIYVPRHRAIADFSMDYKNLKCNWNTNYTSGVTGINDDLEGFLLSNVTMAFQFGAKQKIQSRIAFTIENIFNESYRVVERRPMPGCLFQLQWTTKIFKQ